MPDRPPLHDAGRGRNSRRGREGAMDTRGKILNPEAARHLLRPVTIVSGTFDVLRAGHARELSAIRNRLEGTVLAVVLPGENTLMPQAARAELVAALRVI